MANKQVAAENKKVKNVKNIKSVKVSKGLNDNNLKFNYPTDRKSPEEIVDGLTLFDDDLMSRVFDKNIPATELILQIILKKKFKVLSVKGQSTLKSPIVDGRTITLDIEAEDDKGNSINIEVQGNSSGADIKRARFHSSMLDSRMLDKNEKFSDIKDSYVIFIYKHDKYKLGLPIYHIERTLLETGKKVNDGSHIIYVNGSYSGRDKIGKLISDFKSTKSEGMNFSELKKGVKQFKETKKGREIMCEAVKEYAEAYGEEIRVETRIDVVKNIMKNMKYNVEQAMDVAGIKGKERKLISSAISK